MSTILGLDASSTMIGYCLLQGNRVLSHGEIKLLAANIAAVLLGVARLLRRDPLRVWRRYANTLEVV